MRNRNTVILATFPQNILEVFVDFRIEFRTEFTGTRRVNEPISVKLQMFKQRPSPPET